MAREFSDVVEETASKTAGIFLNYLEGGTSEPQPFENVVKRFNRYIEREQEGKEAIATRLGLNINEFIAFAKEVRRLGSDLRGSSSHRLISQLRFLGWVSTIADRKPSNFPPIPSLPTEDSEQVAQKKVRAVELVLRAMVNERYQSQNKLIKRLRDIFKSDVVEKWLKSAAPNDILTGTLFSEVAAIFTHPKEFDLYQPIYATEERLTFLNKQRDTIVDFLDDIRRVRNQICHHRPLSTIQIELLNIYYEAIIMPIQALFDRSETKIDPDVFLDIDRENLGRYVKDIHEDIVAVECHLKDLGGKISVISERTKLILAGVALIVLLSSATLWLTGGLRTETAAIHVGVDRLEQGVGQTKTTVEHVAADVTNINHKIDTVKKESSDDPRKELANIGITWSAESLLNAMEQGDMRVLDLFMKGGMSPVAVTSGCPTIFYAIARHGINIGLVIDRLVAAGLDVNQPLPCHPSASSDYSGPLLKYAILYRNGEAVESLLSHGTQASLTIQAMLRTHLVRDTDFAARYREVIKKRVNENSNIPRLQPSRKPALVPVPLPPLSPGNPAKYWARMAAGLAQLGFYQGPLDGADKVSVEPALADFLDSLRPEDKANYRNKGFHAILDGALRDEFKLIRPSNRSLIGGAPNIVQGNLSAEDIEQLHHLADQAASSVGREQVWRSVDGTKVGRVIAGPDQERNCAAFQIELEIRGSVYLDDPDVFCKVGQGWIRNTPL